MSEDGINNRPSAPTRAICGEHLELICDLAKALGKPRALVLRSIIDQWVKSAEGDVAWAVVENWRREQGR
jgi:hypothetical protein